MSGSVRTPINKAAASLPGNTMDIFQIGDDRDFVIGRYRLSKHLGLDMAGNPAFGDDPHGQMSVLDDMVPQKRRRQYARELSLLETNLFASGRVALFICFCGDLDCGALTVDISGTSDTVRWSAFGSESTWEDGLYQSDHMKRTGPFTFERNAYLNALSTYR